MLYEIVWQGSKKEIDDTLITPIYRQAFEWTTEPPTQEGWYWAKGNDKTIIVEAFRHTENGVLFFRSGWETIFESEFSAWLGPLPVPEIDGKNDSDS